MCVCEASGTDVSALMPRMSESEVFVGLPRVDIRSQGAALLVMLVAPWCIQGTYKPLRRGGDGPNVRELRVRPTLCPTSQHLASGLLVGEFCNLLLDDLKISSRCIQVKLQI